MSQEQVYLKGFNKVENSVLFPDDASIDLTLGTSGTLDLTTVKSWIPIILRTPSFDTESSSYVITFRFLLGNYTINHPFSSTYLSTYNDNLSLFLYYMLYSIYKSENGDYIKEDMLKYLIDEEKNNRPTDFETNISSLGGTYYVPYDIENFVYDENTQNVDPKHILGLPRKITFNDNPWLSDSSTGSENITTGHITLHLKSIHSFNFLQDGGE